MFEATEDKSTAFSPLRPWCATGGAARDMLRACHGQHIIWGLFCALFVMVGASARGQDEAVNREYPLKALFLYNFGSYIEWPEGTFANEQAPFVIGVIGSAPLDETLNQIAAAKKIGPRRIMIEHYRTPADIKNCQILFVPASTTPQQQSKVIDAVKNQPVLTVGESPNFATSGGDINFFVQDNKIRFEVNVEATKRQQLKINSKLLAMARIVGDGAPKKR